MALKITTLKNAKKDAALVFIVYGDPGVGKTSLINTMPDPILIDLERGFTTLEKDVEIAVCDTLDDVRSAIKHAIKTGKKSIVIDSIARLLDVMANDILEKNKLQKLRIQDYGTIAKSIKDLFWNLKVKNKINVLATGYPVEENSDGDDSQTYIRLAVSPKSLRSALPGVCDLLGYMFVDKAGKRKILVQASPRVHAKSRVTKKGVALVDPDIGKIVDDYLKMSGVDQSSGDTESDVSELDMRDDKTTDVSKNSKQKQTKQQEKTSTVNDDHAAIRLDADNKETPTPTDADKDTKTPAGGSDDSDANPVAESSLEHNMPSAEVKEAQDAKPDSGKSDDVKITADQIATIRKLVNKMAEEPDGQSKYAELVRTKFGVKSAKDLTEANAAKLIKILEATTNV